MTETEPMIHDTEDLDALFEAALSEAQAKAKAPSAPEAAAPDLARACPNAGPDGTCPECTCGSARDLRERVGRLTRDLHESLRELSLDRTLADVASEIPDARSRLKYVTEMCERSAQKVLDTLDALSPIQQSIHADAGGLLSEWQRMLDARERPADGYLALFERTRAHLGSTVDRTERMSGMHTDIMMAQDFQDLTGQVCRKIEAITERIESQLLNLLLETAPEDHKARRAEMLEGPQVEAGRADAVTGQAEVDDLLASLGF